MTKTQQPLACIILAAGHGTRMKSALPKVLHELAGRPLLSWVMDTASSLAPEKIVVVTAPDDEAVRTICAPHKTAVQKDRRGTADAVKAALPALAGFSGDVLILMGDAPLAPAADLRGLIAARHKDGAALSVLGMDLADPASFGRLVVGENGALEKIVEARDATPAELGLTLCNAGVYCIDGARLAGWIEKIGDKNAQKEFYLTDIVAVAAADGAKTNIHTGSDAEKLRGINSRTELAAQEKIAQIMLRTAAMDNGVTMIDPDSVFLSWDTKLGRDVIIEPSVFFGPGVTIADGVHIKAFSHLEGAIIGKDATIGPHARLRPGSKIGEGSKIGNFVEIKNATLGAGVKASHLAYIGDADVGAGANFSCGAITVNYDGFNKHRTVIGENAMVGSNVNLVAPVEIGAGAYVAAGSTITKDVPADALAVAREKPSIIAGWAANFRKKKKKAG